MQPQANPDHRTQIIWGSGVFDAFLLPTLEKLVVAYIISLMVGYTKFHEGTADLEYHSPFKRYFNQKLALPSKATLDYCCVIRHKMHLPVI